MIAVSEIDERQVLVTIDPMKVVVSGPPSTTGPGVVTLFVPDNVQSRTALLATFARYDYLSAIRALTAHHVEAPIVMLDDPLCDHNAAL
jgi:hypothetical protein